MRVVLGLLIVLAGCGARTTCLPQRCEDTSECGVVDDGCGETLECACPEHCEGDADCASGAFCDLVSRTCSSACRTGTHVALDVPRRGVDVEVTLGSAASPDAGPARSPELIFWRPEAIEHLAFGSRLPLYEDGAPSLRRATLAPGRYRVQYVFDEEDDAWPTSHGVFVAEVEVEPDTERIAIDVPVVDVTVAVSLDGAPVPASEDPLPELWLRAEGIYRPWAAVAELSVASAAPRRLVPGTFQLWLERADADPARWPASGALAEAVDVSAGILDVDVATIEVGVAIESQGATAPDGVRLGLHPAGEVPRRVPEELPATVGGRTDARVLAGVDYEVWSLGGPSGWPAAPTQLADLVATVPDTVVRLVRDVENVPVRARLAAEGPASCPFPVHVLVGGLEVPITLGEEPAVEVTVPLFHGTHRPTYHGPEDDACPLDGTWPTGATLLAAIEVADATPVAIVVERIVVEPEVTMDGGPLPELVSLGPEALYDLPHLVLGRGPEAPDGAFQIDVPLYARDGLFGAATPRAPPHVTLVPGRYDLVYSPGGNGSRPHPAVPLAWAALEEARAIDADGSLAIALSTVAVRIDLTIGGQPPPADIRASIGGGGWPPGLYFRGPSVRSWRQWPWRDDGAHATMETPALQGRYEVWFDHTFGFPLHATGPLPPPSVPLGCWEL